MLQITITASDVAYWGAMTGTLALLIQLLKYLSERVRIAVHAERVYLCTEGGPVDDDWIHLGAVNTGPRPVALVNARLVMSDGTRGLVDMAEQPTPSRPLPVRLEEGDSVDVFCRLSILREFETTSGARVVGVDFTDKARCTYKKRWRPPKQGR